MKSPAPRCFSLVLEDPALSRNFNNSIWNRTPLSKVLHSGMANSSIVYEER